MRTFNHEHLDGLDCKLEQINEETGRRYKTPEGNLYPSITTVLGSIRNDELDAWRVRVGEKEANEVSRRASGRGTRVHNLIEKYLLNEVTDMDIRRMMPDLRDMFRKIRPYIDEHIGTIYGVESRLYSDRLKIAGTCDCIAEWDGVISIIDWKTSNYQKEKCNIDNYFMQATAYADMVYERVGIPIQRVVVAINVEHEGSQVYVEDTSNYIAKLERCIFDYYLLSLDKK
jgi:genome maintenance exonuclease 1